MATKKGTSGSYPDNKYPPGYLGEPRTETDVNMKAITPNGPRPIEVVPTKYLFGTWGD